MISSKIDNSLNSINFPCLMSNDSVVAIVKSKHEAVVVHKLVNNASEIGEIMGTKDHGFNIDRFKAFNGGLLLSNM